MPPAIGVIVLDELQAFAPWARVPLRIRRAALDAPLLPPTIVPPPAVVVVTSHDPGPMTRSLDWLGLADRIVVLREGRLEPDPGLAELEARSWADMQARVGGRLDVLDVGPEGLDVAIERARQRIGRVDTPWIPFTSDRAAPAVRSGPWIDWQPGAEDGELACLRHLAPALCRPDGRPALLDKFTGSRIDLRTGDRLEIPNLLQTAQPWWPIAARPDGTGWLRIEGARHNAWALEGPHGAVVRDVGWGRPFGIEPEGRIAWVGQRCTFHWRIIVGDEHAWWTPSDHDWPSGHAKKLYGHDDNDPLYVALAPDATACLSVYDHDTLLCPGLPLRWRSYGEFAVAERSEGEPRALLFERGDEEDAYPADPYAAEEDARDRFAVATLGPTTEQRYVVGLQRPTYRLVSGTVERLGGPDGGWIVCNDRHEIVRRDAGRLLSGWDRWVVLERDGRLWREDLVAGTREALGEAGRSIVSAVAVQGTPNVVLLSLDGRPAVRLL